MIFRGNKLRLTILGLLAVLVTAGVFAIHPALAQQADNHYVDNVPPTPQGDDIYVTDLAGLITSDDRDSMTAVMRQLDQNGTAQVAVLVLPDTTRDLSEFAPVIMNKWGVGHKSNDDGVLILVNAYRVTHHLSGNRIFVGTGYGVEGVLPDVRVGRILDENAIPAFSNGEYSTGILNTVTAIAAVFSSPGTAAPPPPASDDGLSTLLFYLFIWFILFGIRALWFKNSNWTWGGYGGYGGSDFGGGFGGGGFGGGGFGGGGSGGGGAGR